MEHNPDLTSSELAAIWSSYMGDSLNICVMKHFLTTVLDTDVKEIIQYSKDISEGHLNSLRSIFIKEHLPIPLGYTDADVNEKAPKLYSDTFYLRFLQTMARYGCLLNGTVLGTTYREDIRDYYTAAMNESGELYNRIVTLLKTKGTLIRSPYIAYPTEIEFVEGTSFFEGRLTLNKRPLLAIEITHLANNIEMNYIGRTLADGLAQVTNSKEIKKHMQTGYDLATEIINTLEKTLKDEHISTPTSPDSAMTNSTVSPFSDKLLIGLNSTLAVISIGSLGLGLGASVRSDLVTEYAQLITRVGKFGVKTETIAIKNKWMEKPPQTMDRKNLQNKK